MRTARILRRFPVALAALLAGCAVGPKYQPPSTPVAPSWKEPAPWSAARPEDALPKGKWWTLFADDDLNRLEEQALAANATLDVARNQLRQAQAIARISSSGLFPQISAGPSALRQRLSGNRPTNSGSLVSSPVSQNNFQVPFSLSYEADLFGGVRAGLAASNARYQESAAGLENVRLVLASELAADYFSLRELDAEIAVVDSAVEYQQRGLKLVQNRHDGGIASGLDVSQQQTLLDSTRTQAELLLQQRARVEHAIAVLVGTSASTFSLPAAALHTVPPAVPLGVPSDLLQRRPDIAQAEREMAAENAFLGVARSALYPSVGLGLGGGWQSRELVSLLDVSSTFWALGSSLLQSVANGGRNRAQVEASQAAYDVAAAGYRQTVLTAFAQVEDAISGLTVLARAAQTQDNAVADARRALQLANDRYVGGLVSYLDVINAQETLLTNQRLATQILGQRLVTSVALVKALGGGWDAASLAPFQVKPEARQAIRQ